MRPATVLRLLLVGLLAAVLLAVTRTTRVTVDGDSMRPALLPGDRLLVLRRRPRVGEVVVLRDPRVPGRIMVKRVHAVLPEGLDVRGDNPAASTDSRTFGPVAPRLVIGRAIYRYDPADRAGWLRGRPRRGQPASHSAMRSAS